MAKILFDRDSLLWSGTDRDKLPYEVEILNVNVDALTKEIPVNVKREKYTEDGKAVYLVYQAPVEKEVVNTEIVETTEETPNPVTVIKMVQVPLLDENGTQVEYQPLRREMTTDVSDEPVMYMVYDEENDVDVPTQATNEEGELLFYNEIPSGPVIKCTIEEEQEVQKTDGDGNLIYTKEVTTTTIVLEEQELLEVTEDDELFVEGLPRAVEDAVQYRIATFENEPELFTYEDIVAHKEKQVTKGTFASKATLYETFLTDVFSDTLASFNADLGFDFISIPPGGEARTKKLTLPITGQFVTVKYESSEAGLKVSVGATVDDITPVDRNNERYFSQNETAVYVLFENPTDKRIDLNAFALLV